MLIEKGVALNYPNAIISKHVDSSLPRVLKSGTDCFVELMQAFVKKDIVAQHKYLNELYMVTSQLQCFAARSKLNA